MNFDFLKKYNWKEISDEWYGVRHEPVKEEPVNEVIPESYIKKKNFPVEIEGVMYDNTRDASEKLGINYHTLRDWISGRRGSKLQCKKLNG